MRSILAMPRLHIIWHHSSHHRPEASRGERKLRDDQLPDDAAKHTKLQTSNVTGKRQCRHCFTFFEALLPCLCGEGSAESRPFAEGLQKYFVKLRLFLQRSIGIVIPQADVNQSNPHCFITRVP